MQKNIKTLGNFLFIIFLISCNTHTPMSASEISSLISYSYPYSQEMRVGEQIDIFVTNETDYCLVFPLVGGLTIYTEENDEHIEVKNLVNIIGNQNLTISPKGEPLSSRMILLQPNTSSILIEKPTTFFVKLTGYLCDDENFLIEKIIPFTITP
jgi:hypothetical protein